MLAVVADEGWKCLLLFARGPVIKGSHSGHRDFEWAHSVQLGLLKHSLGQCPSYLCRTVGRGGLEC